jgi:hypothetical protein
MHKRIPLLLPFVLITITFGTVYGCLQQLLRQNANDPQIAIAEDITQRLNEGVSPDVLLSNPVDVSKNSSPATTVYKKDGTIVASTIRIGETTPFIAHGALTAADARTYNAVTWQPTKSVRLASVNVAAKDYYVSTVRSLREVEKREAYMLRMTAFGWTFSMLTAAAGMLWFAMPDKVAKRVKTKK